MKRTTPIAICLLIALGAAAVPATAQTPNCDPGTAYSCFMLRAPYGLQQQIAANHGLTLLGEIRPGRPELVRAIGPSSLLPETALANLKGDPDVTDVELVTLNMLTETDATSLLNLMPPNILPNDLLQQGLYVGPETVYFQDVIWNGYASQTALGKINVPMVHWVPEMSAMGSGVVAVIDTGVDPSHERLVGALVPGYDFILDQPGASEWNALASPATTEGNLRAIADQSHTAIVDGNGTLDTTYPAMQPVVDQSHTAIVDDNGLPAGFGHGTMVAGIVRIVAPGAQIMPLQVFDGNGQADLSRVVEAIYYAVDNGANVINMSFSITSHSNELARAIKYAKRKGVVCVSSAGNWGSTDLTYPAADGNVIGVAATGLDDTLSYFSNHGSDLITVGAPGEQVITLYPGDLYAAAWGTSFSTAFVAGSVALLHDKDAGSLKTISYRNAEGAISDGADATVPANTGGEVGAGRLDSYYAYQCGPYNGDATECASAP